MPEKFPKKEEATGKLLPREQFREKSKEYGKPPFTLEIRNERQGLYYFGANHSHNPEDPQYPILREYWQKFLEETKDKVQVVLVEGWVRKIQPDETEAMAIMQGSEGDFITFLAQKDQIPTVCPDLGQEELMARLPHFSQEEFFILSFIRYADHCQHRTHKRLPILPRLQGWCDWQNQQGRWDSITITPENVLELYQKIIGRPFSEEENFNAMHNPNKTGTRINELSRAASDLRDENVVAEIKRYWDEGKSILVVFGSGHLIIEEPALKALLK